MRKLGHWQRDVLRQLVSFGAWKRSDPVWNIVYSSVTEPILRSLVRRGLAEETQDEYRPTDLGKKTVENME